jgi:prepilin-type N-terminal cleavage/methylation domain-containing protein
MTNNQAGLTLLELLISVTILGIIVVGLHQALGTSLSAYEHTRNKQDLLTQARWAMKRMVMFAQETDVIQTPDEASSQEILKISERAVDTYDNATHAYVVGGDGLLDADNDGDSLINEGGSDPQDFITFDLDKTDASNWKLQEEMPDYSTAAESDFSPRTVICEHVTSFQCNRLANNLIQIELTLNEGKAGVSLKTRVWARLMD